MKNSLCFIDSSVVSGASVAAYLWKMCPRWMRSCMLAKLGFISAVKPKKDRSAGRKNSL